MPWDRPKTIKLHLQPLACDRLITLWPDLKIVRRAYPAGDLRRRHPSPAGRGDEKMGFGARARERRGALQ